MSGGNRADQRCLGHPAFAVTGQIVRYLATAGRVTDMYRVLEVEVRRERCEIINIMIHVMTAAGLSRSATPATIMSDDAEALV
jgi:hypothetical protein